MPDKKPINLPKFIFSQKSEKYASCTCKRPYNILSIAMLTLDPFAPGYFLNIPPRNKFNSRNTTQCIKEPLLGRGCEEVTFQEIYFFYVAILKIVTLFLLFYYLIADSSDVDLEDSSFFIGNEKPLLKGNKYALIFALGIGVHLLIPMILTIVSDITTGQSNMITVDLLYIVSTPKYWIHSLVQAGFSVGQMWLLINL